MLVLAIDGIDGVGKDTQAALLRAELESGDMRVRVVTCPELTSPLCGAITEVLQQGKAEPRVLQLLFIAERIIEQSKWLGEAHEVVILVRSVWATLVYGEALGVESEWLKTLIQPVRDPDLIFLLDMPVHEAMARTPAEDPLESDLDLQEYCRQRYLELAAAASNWAVINGSNSVQTVHADVLKALKQHTAGTI